MHHAPVSEVTARETPFTFRPTWWAAALLISVTSVLAVGVQLSFRTNSPLHAAAGWSAPVLVVLGIVATLSPRGLARLLTSYSLSTVLLVAIATGTAAGTLVVQKAAPAAYDARYGAFAATAFQWLFLHDVFNVYWFNALLSLLAVSLFLTLLRPRRFGLRQLSLMLSHGGLVLVLLGGLVGFLGGERGFLRLEQGASTESMAVVHRGAVTETRRPLGFEVRLEAFELDHHAAKHQLFAYRADAGDYEAIRAYSLDDTRRHRIPGSAIHFRLLSVAGDDTDFPAAELEIESPQGRRQDSVRGKPFPPLYLDRGRIVLALVARDDDVRTFRSLVSIWREGEMVKRDWIEVNRPLVHDGYHLHLSDYQRDNPNYAGLRVVRDPGLWCVYVGLALVCLGAMYLLFPARTTRGEG